MVYDPNDPKKNALEPGGASATAMPAQAGGAPTVAPAPPRPPATPAVNAAPAMAPQTGGVPSVAPPRAGGAPSNVQQYANDWMANPSRMDMDFVRQGTELIDRAAEKGFDRGRANLDEVNSSRGLVGSSIEQRGNVDMAESVNGQRMQRLFDLQKLIAETSAGDRAAAGSFGLGVAGLGETSRQFDTSMGESGRQFDASLGQRQTEFGGQMGLSQQDINLRAQQLQQQAQLAGRSLTIEEARLQASTQLQREGMAQQGQQFQQGMTQREREFAATQGLNEQQLRVQQEQFGRSMAEQIASRLQQGDQYASSLASDNRFRQFAADAQMRGLDLEEAAQAWQREYGTRSQDLQETALNDDTRLRTAQVLSSILGVDADPAIVQQIMNALGMGAQPGDTLTDSGTGSEQPNHKWGERQGEAGTGADTKTDSGTGGTQGGGGTWFGGYAPGTNLGGTSAQTPGGTTPQLPGGTSPQQPSQERLLQLFQMMQGMGGG